MQVLASQLHFLANRNAGLAIPPLLWPINCIKIGGHVALLSGPTVYSLYCAQNENTRSKKDKQRLFIQTLNLPQIARFPFLTFEVIHSRNKDSMC